MALTQLGRHAEQALRLSIRLLDAEMTNVRLGEALARIGIGVLALDSVGRVVFANPEGERLLEPYMNADRRLRLDSVADQAPSDRLGKLLCGRAEDVLAPPKPILLRCSGGQRPLVVYLLPMTEAVSPVEEFLTRTRLIVLAIDSGAGDPIDPAVVREVLGVTLGEARIAALVGTGLPPRDAAARLGISEETARTTLKRVFAKTGVSRQSELAALLTRLVLR
jgi:DNA-binding CsgD family transcriptional regulator